MWVPDAFDGEPGGRTVPDAGTDDESDDELETGPDEEPEDESEAEPDEEPEATSDVEQRRLPPGVSENLEALFDADRPETFGEWVDVLATTFGDEWPPAVDRLCHDDAGRHRAEVGDRTYRFTCVLDAILLPFLTEGAVDVRSEGPWTGEVVTARVPREDVEVSPDDAVMSFGVADVEAGTDPTPETLYGAMCPYIHAFPDREAYEQWAAETDAATTGLPFSEGFALARAMAQA